jgi:hypothetical protein
MKLKKVIKRPNTVKMKRLLLQLIECDRSDRQQLRQIQEDAAKVLGIDAEEFARIKQRKRS